MSKTLLLADDSVVIQKLVGLSFANEDVEIIATDNGDDAIAKAREVSPDVVLADVVMPGKSGYEVCEAIKQDPALAHVPVLLLTGTFEAFDESRAEAVGATGQITKPFEAQALVERVNEVMNAPQTIAEQPEAAATADESSTDDFDFFDADAQDLSGDESQDLLAAVDTGPGEAGTDDDLLFGEPGEATPEELETEGGGLALGDPVAAAPPEADDATVAILPEAPPPLPSDAVDPLEGFGDELELDDLGDLPTATPSAAVDLDAAIEVDAADPGATIVANVDDKNAATSPDLERLRSARAKPVVDEDLTIHTPTSAIDQDAAAAPTPAAEPAAQPVQAEATVVANLDISLAEPAAPTPKGPAALDLGPSNVTSEDLDFAFDVSEQMPVSDLEDPLGDSFSSLMDISESQILAGPAEAVSIQMDAAAAHSVPDDSIAAGYDVSTSDLATAPPTPEKPAADAGPGIADAIEAGGSTGRATPPAPTAIELDDDAEHDALQLADAPSGPSTGERVTDLSPLAEQQIQETLEKVAWEAFSDLSETIVKQVIGRVEKIAWEVIPQMAETLVREEIRKMKGEKD